MTLVNIFFHYIIVRLYGYIVHLLSTTDCSCSSELIIDACSKWIFETVGVMPKRSAKIQLSRVF